MDGRFISVNPILGKKLSRAMNLFNPAQLAKLGGAALPQTAPAIKFAQEQQSVLERSLRPYFDITTSTFLKRLGLLVFPYVRFTERSADLPLDLYMPLMGHAAYGVVMAFKEILSTGGFKPALFTRNVILAAMIVGLEALVVISISSSISLKVPKLELIALSCYKVFVSVLVSFVSIFSKILYYVALVWLGVSLGVHLAFYGIGCIKATQSELYLSRRQISIQNWFVLLWAIMQPVLLFVLTIL